MTKVEDLRARIEEGVRASLMPHLFERALKVHKNKAWRSCSCSYCRAKVQATNIIACTNRDRRYFEREEQRKILRRLG